MAIRRWVAVNVGATLAIREYTCDACVSKKRLIGRAPQAFVWLAPHMGARPSGQNVQRTNGERVT